MLIGNRPATIFKNNEAAMKICEGMDKSEYRIDADPKGSGRCLVRILDEETGEILGSL